MMQTIFFWSAVSLYAVATAMFFIWAAFGKDWGDRWGNRLAAVGLLPHAVSLGLRWAEVGHGPYNTQYEVLSSNSFILICAYVLSSRFVKSIRSLGVFVLPAAFLMMGWAVSSFEVKKEVPIIFKSYWLFLHIAFAKAFAATVILASCCAILYLIQSRKGGLSRFPSRERLDLYSHQFLLISFLFLGVMIVAGSLWAHQSWGRYWAWDPIETSALVTWVVMGIILHFRTLHHWSGTRMAYLTLVGLVFAILTLFVVTLVMPTVHNSYMVGK